MKPLQYEILNKLLPVEGLQKLRVREIPGLGFARVSFSKHIRSLGIQQKHFFYHLHPLQHRSARIHSLNM